MVSAGTGVGKGGRSRQPLVGCIADDLTGATDIAATFASRGMTTQLLIGSGPWAESGDAEAIVVALKSRTSLAAVAVADSLASMKALADRGASSFIFKYCSTFDSTSQGNIGPVAEALLAEVDQDLVTFCPSFPANGRTVVDGQLLVDGIPLDKSSMRSHPLTPMRCADVVTLLQPQVNGRVEAVGLNTVRRGPDALRARLRELAASGVRFAVVDAVVNADLETIGQATSHLPLVTGSSAVALGFPATSPDAGLKGRGSWMPSPGAALVVAGSCSAATLRQVETFASRHSSYRLDVPNLLAGNDEVAGAVAWSRTQPPGKPLLIYSSEIQPDRALTVPASHLGAASQIEGALAEVAAQVVAERRVRRLIVAGGETSGAVAARLGISAVEIGPLIAPGVPWTYWRGDWDVAVAFKSGNFGSDDFFERALEVIA